MSKCKRSTQRLIDTALLVVALVLVGLVILLASIGPTIVGAELPGQPPPIPTPLPEPCTCVYLEPCTSEFVDACEDSYYWGESLEENCPASCVYAGAGNCSWSDYCPCDQHCIQDRCCEVY